jgi:hypothetical protein
MGMEPAPAARSSRLSVLLAAGGLVALLLAGWCFWQLWNARNNPGNIVVAANAAPPVASPVIAPPVAAPQPAPVTPAAPANPAPAPVVVSAPPVAASPVAPPPAPPIAAREKPIAWPVELKLNAIFFSTTHPRVLINGNLYGTGDEVQGVVLKKIEKDEVTVEWNGHSKVLMINGD